MVFTMMKTDFVCLSSKKNILRISRRSLDIKTFVACY